MADINSQGLWSQAESVLIRLQDVHFEAKHLSDVLVLAVRFLQDSRPALCGRAGVEIQHVECGKCEGAQNKLFNSC